MEYSSSDDDLRISIICNFDRIIPVNMFACFILNGNCHCISGWSTRNGF